MKKEKLKNFLNSKFLPIFLLCFSVISSIAVYTFRFSWVFVDIAVKIDGFVLAVLCLMILNAFALGVFSVLRLNGVKTKAYKTALYIAIPLTVLSTIIGIVFTVVACSKESSGVAFEYFKSLLPKIAFLVLVPAAVIFVPALSKKGKKIAVSLVLVFTILFAFLSVFPITPYKITSDPAVLDNGSGYSVVFATTDEGTGYVTYTFDNKEYKVFDETGGRLDCTSKIHTVQLPYEHLKNNTYKVGSTRVIDQFSYGSRLGRNVESGEYAFKVNETENQTYLTISDWHTNLKKAYKAIEYAGDYEGVILMGDSSPGLDFEAEAVRNIVEFAGEISGGKMPIIYARGNHETRGAYAGELMTALGLKEFYYQTKIGDVNFVVLDSGEDKDDSHPEYGGLDNYNAYRAKQVEWLKTVNVDSGKVISLSHSWQVSDVEQELSNTAWAELDRLGVSLMISGHTHQCRFVGSENEREEEIFLKYPHIKAYMDGGISGNGYIASKLTFNNKEILIEAYNDSGEKVFDEKVEW